MLLELRATGEHRFYVDKQGWVALEDMNLGDFCISHLGEPLVLVSKTFDSTPTLVYNLEVENCHTYFVGNENCSILVHNDYDDNETTQDVSVNPSKPVNVEWARVEGFFWGALQGGANDLNAVQDVLVGIGGMTYNGTSWVMNNTLGTSNPYYNANDLGWSASIGLYNEGDMHGWNKLPADIGAESALLAATLGGTKLGATPMRELPGVAWNGVKSAGKGAWNGMKNAGENAWTGTKNAGKNAWNGMKSAGENIKNWWSGTSKVTKEKFTYSRQIQQKALTDPHAHNFPYSFDKCILETKPIIKPDGYRIYQLEGYMNGKKGVFEIGITPDNVINHRFFRPIK